MKDDPNEQLGNRRLKMIMAALAMIAIFIIIGMALWSYIDAFFIALFAFIFLHPVYKKIRSFGLNKTFSALIAMVLGFVIIGIPTIITFQLLIEEIKTTLTPDNIQLVANSVSGELQSLHGIFPTLVIDTKTMLLKAATSLATYAQAFALGSIESISHTALELLIFIFVLYYLLVGEGDLKKLGDSVIPFNQKNKERLFKEFKNVTYAVLVCTVIMALLQAVPLTLAFMYYKIPGAMILGAIGLILSFIPFLGMPFVWIPVAVIELMQGNYDIAIGLTILGVIIAILENVRPLVLKGLGEIHPLISVLGVIVGLAIFGIVGMIIGPLVLSYAILIAQMFKEEYVNG